MDIFRLIRMNHIRKKLRSKSLSGLTYFLRFESDSFFFEFSDKVKLTFKNFVDVFRFLQKSGHFSGKISNWFTSLDYSTTKDHGKKYSLLDPRMNRRLSDVLDLGEFFYKVGLNFHIFKVNREIDKRRLFLDVADSLSRYRKPSRNI